ncbi:MAG: phage virion morphogenesis protein [Terriglobia bacterium]
MIKFTYADNSEEVSKALESFQAALADNTPALREIAGDFREMIAEQFASEGRAGGTPWTARNTSGGADIASGRGRTMSAKRKPQTWRRSAMSAPPSGRGNTSPLLVRTGALRDSLTRTGAGHIEEMDEGSLILGTRVPYAMFHQLGTRRMPARPIIVLTGERAQRWSGFVRNVIEQKSLLGANELGGKEL